MGNNGELPDLTRTGVLLVIVRFFLPKWGWSVKNEE